MKLLLTGFEPFGGETINPAQEALALVPDRIGALVMDKLKGVDEVAYVRFASVYRQFKDISTFMAELSKLLEEK